MVGKINKPRINQPSSINHLLINTSNGLCLYHAHHCRSVDKTKNIKYIFKCPLNKTCNTRGVPNQEEEDDVFPLPGPMPLRFEQSWITIKVTAEEF